MARSRRPRLARHYCSQRACSQPRWFPCPPSFVAVGGHPPPTSMEPHIGLIQKSCIYTKNPFSDSMLVRGRVVANYKTEGTVRYDTGASQTLTLSNIIHGGPRIHPNSIKSAFQCCSISIFQKALTITY